jgi:hypothetical protein
MADMEQYPQEWRQYEPIQPRGTDWRGLFRKLWAPIAGIGAFLAKFGVVLLKFNFLFSMFVKVAEGFLVFPGGFGTVDELFEALTLIQTGKVFHFPVVLYDTDYWAELMGWIKGELLADGMISPNDLDLLFVTDDLDEAVERVRHGYKQRSSEIPAAPVKADAQ